MVSILSLGFIISGIGCLSWAIFNLWVQPGYSADTGSYYSSRGTFAAQPTSLKGDTAAPSKPDDQAKTPAPHKILYPVYPAEGDWIGSLMIPALKLQMPIFQGTDAKELSKGVGHFSQSVLPGEKDNCVLSGHRDSVFAKLGKLKIGDQLMVQTAAGMFTYEIKGIRIVDKDDRTVIVPADHAILTLSTCYPFRYIGNAPKRYILTADLVTSQ